MKRLSDPVEFEYTTLDSRKLCVWAYGKVLAPEYHRLNAELIDFDLYVYPSWKRAGEVKELLTRRDLPMEWAQIETAAEDALYRDYEERCAS